MLRSFRWLCGGCPLVAHCVMRMGFHSGSIKRQGPSREGRLQVVLLACLITLDRFDVLAGLDALHVDPVRAGAGFILRCVSDVGCNVEVFSVSVADSEESIGDVCDGRSDIYDLYFNVDDEESC